MTPRGRNTTLDLLENIKAAQEAVQRATDRRTIVVPNEHVEAFKAWLREHEQFQDRVSIVANDDIPPSTILIVNESAVERSLKASLSRYLPPGSGRHRPTLRHA